MHRARILSGVAMRFANQVAVVTGASSGIGWELGKCLAAEGARVGLLARLDNLERLAQEIRQAGGTAACAAADVADRMQVHAAVKTIQDQLGPVDLLIANAGVGMPTLLDPVNIADIEKMMRLNVIGVLYAIEAALPQMLERRRGQPAAVSSLAAY